MVKSRERRERGGRERLLKVRVGNEDDKDRKVAHG